jgi:hypothetical protein
LEGTLAPPRHDRREQRQPHDGTAADECRATEPGHVRQPGEACEQQEHQGQDVVHPLDDDRRGDLGERRPRRPIEGDRARRLAGASRKQDVAEVADVERLYHRGERRPALGSEQPPPTHGSNEERDNEESQARGKPRVVRVPERFPCLARPGVANGDVREGAADEETDPHDHGAARWPTRR